jgi:hypothetical protein
MIKFFLFCCSLLLQSNAFLHLAAPNRVKVPDRIGLVANSVNIIAVANLNAYSNPNPNSSSNTNRNHNPKLDRIDSANSIESITRQSLKTLLSILLFNILISANPIPALALAQAPSSLNSISDKKPESKVYLPSGLKESISKGAANIPGKYLSLYFSLTHIHAHTHTHTLNTLILKLSHSLALIPTPGFGQPDIYYPSAYEGMWKVKQTFYDFNIKNDQETVLFVDTLINFEQERSKHLNPSPNLNANANPRTNPNLSPGPVPKTVPVAIELEYISNYVDYNGNIVLDRSFSESNKYQALLKKTYGSSDKSASTGASKGVTASWELSNPNILTVTTSDNKVIGYKVTKRAVEDKLGTGSFGLSEYSQIFQTSDNNPVPKVGRTREGERERERESNMISNPNPNLNPNLHSNPNPRFLDHARWLGFKK